MTALRQRGDFAAILFRPLGAQRGFYGCFNRLAALDGAKPGPRGQIQGMRIARRLIENGAAIGPAVNEKLLSCRHASARTISRRCRWILDN